MGKFHEFFLKSEPSASVQHPFEKGYSLLEILQISMEACVWWVCATWRGIACDSNFGGSFSIDRDMWEAKRSVTPRAVFPFYGEIATFARLRLAIFVV